MEKTQPVSRAPAGALNQACDRPTRKSLWNGPSRQHPNSTENQLGPPRDPRARHPAPHQLRHPPPWPFPSPVPWAPMAPCLGFPPQSSHIPPEPPGVCCLCPPLSVWGLGLQSWASSECCLFKARVCTPPLKSSSDCPLLKAKVQHPRTVPAPASAPRQPSPPALRDSSHLWLLPERTKPRPPFTVWSPRLVSKHFAGSPVSATGGEQKPGGPSAALLHPVPGVSFSEESSCLLSTLLSALV